jgi:hypothetical protein
MRVLRKPMEKSIFGNTKMRASMAHPEIHRRHKEDGRSPKPTLNMKPSYYNTKENEKTTKTNSSTHKD